MSTLNTRRRRTLPVALVLGAAAVTGALWLVPDGGSARAAVDETGTLADTIAEVATVQPTRQDLSIGHEASGSITAAATQTVASPTDGTLVSIVEQGDTIGPGDVIAVVDDRPVSVIEGTVPMWRDLGVGDEGADVEQLEVALVALGFDPDANVTIDDEYTSATAAMVAEWQLSMGADDTGTVGRTDIVVLASPMTVAGGDIAVGASVSHGSSLVGLDSLERIVTASIPVADAVTLAVDELVELRLPDRSVVAGQVRSLILGADASVRLAEIAFVSNEVGIQLFEGVTVEVTWDEIVATDVLTIPADTFRHLDDGTYVVDVVSDDGTIISVEVEPGRQVGTAVEVVALPTDAEIVQP